MTVFTTVTALDSWISGQHAAKRTIGLVPTMGALHEGHIAVVNRAKQENDTVVVTVFVNPVQFNNASDLERYPRTFDTDREMLEQAGVDAMFFPSVDEVYPSKAIVSYVLDGLDTYMEGPNRPGHFNGVVQVVTRFFDIIRPTSAYFGEKDFQQLAIIRHMTHKLGYDVNIVGCATVREPSGLAMSSRNTLLIPEDRNRAPHIYEVLLEARKEFPQSGVSRTREKAFRKLEEIGFRPEYVELINPETLVPVSEGWSGPIQVCVAVWAGTVRLIDNLQLK